MLKDKIEQDLKTAMLSGDKVLTTTLRGLKSVILDAEIANGARDTGLADEDVVNLLAKETKKRQESADMYTQAGETARAEAELAEKQAIARYLPEQLSEKEIAELVDKALTQAGDNPQMGQIIGLVKTETRGSADGSLIAKIVKEKLA